MANPQFIRKLESLAQTPFAYTDVGALDRALEVIDLGRVYAGAETRQAVEIQKNDGSVWGFQDCVIQELLAWFKEDFFSWVNTLPCERCGGETRVIGAAPPTPSERADGADTTELHGCATCRCATRFPRYNSPRKLLETRRGRCGEWANCFCLCARALGSRVRWIWNAEDHVWAEIYSQQQHRWVHADPCENAWDQPMLYSEGWGKKMSYVLGFSEEGCRDVTRRYVRLGSASALSRNLLGEEELKATLARLTAECRRSFPAEQRAELEAEDAAEEKELSGVGKGIEGRGSSEVLPPRQSGSVEWTKERGEAGR